MRSRIALAIIVAAAVAGAVLLAPKTFPGEVQTDLSSSGDSVAESEERGRVLPDRSLGVESKRATSAGELLPAFPDSTVSKANRAELSDALAELVANGDPRPPAGLVTRGQVAREISGNKRLTPPEKQVLLNYNELAFDLQRHQSCEGLGEMVQKRVEAGKPALSHLISTQSELSPMARIGATKRMAAAAPMAARRLRESLQDGLARCPDDEAFRSALRELSAMSHPPQ